MADFASRLRELRNSRGMRQKDLAHALGLAQTTIANYEQKSRFPDEATLGRIADHFNASLDYLLGRSEVNLSLQGLKPSTAGEQVEEEALGEAAHEYLRLVVEGRAAQAAQLVHGLLPAGRSLAQAYLEVFAPALREAGRLWSQGKLDVAREHLLSASTLSFMSQLLGAAVEAAAAERKELSCLCLAVCEEQHLIGVRMLADLLELDGWTTLFLGGNVCTQHVLRGLVDYEPQLLALSVTLPEHLGHAQELIRTVRSSPGLQRVKILVGGQAFQRDGELWRAMGADGGAADAAEAVGLANRLAGGGSG